MIKTIHPGRRFGTVQIPASKSDAQRACLAAALANGVSVLKGIGNSDDERAMLAAIECLGAEIFASGNDLRITGISSFPDHAVLNAGESGLGIRLLTPVCAIQSGTFTIEGRGSLTGRPMHFFEEVLPHFGAQCITQSGFLPLHTSGPMQGGTAKVNASLSSQFVSGLLMALPLAGGDSILQVEQLNSRPYVNMTLNTLSAFGITINETNGVFRIPGNQRYQPTNYTIEADWSSAGYWLVAAALGHELTVQGVQIHSLQADKALIGFLETAGCRIDQTEDGIIVNGATKQSFTVEAILSREKEQVALVFDQLLSIPGLHLHESRHKERLGVFSFHIDNCYSALGVRMLNDRFGIQVRGGCSCAGTYGHYLYNIDKEQSCGLYNRLENGDIYAKPGWIRMSVHPTMSDEELLFICDAIRQLATNYDE